MANRLLEFVLAVFGPPIIVGIHHSAWDGLTVFLLEMFVLMVVEHRSRR